MTTAATISIADTLDLLDSSFADFMNAFQKGMYALWLGSGISRERVVGLDGVLAKLLERLRQRVTTAAGCAHKAAFLRILDLAELSQDQRAQVDFSKPVAEWAIHDEMINRLWNKYSKVLGIDVQGQQLDYLLWDVLDFSNTFSSQKADAEHLVTGMLVLEGAVTEVATANWDELLESAMLELGRPNETYRVAVTGNDLRGPTALGTLYKFHGCAKRAVEDEASYRSLLIAREAQINQWGNNQSFLQMRDQLRMLIARTRTLMIGLSAQDSDIQQLFGASGWRWNDVPAPILFSAQELTDGQKSILEGVYQGDYEPNREQICNGAAIPAYSKALLLALLLQVLTGKIQVLISRLQAPSLDDAAKSCLIDGLSALRTEAARAGNGDRYDFAQKIAAVMGRFSEQFLGGVSRPGPRPYLPVSPQPAHQLQDDQGVQHSGKLEAAAALALIGCELKDLKWGVAIDNPNQPGSGALRIVTPGASARVFFAANDDNISGLISAGAFGEDDGDVVVICSRRATARQQRSPSALLRDGKVSPRYVSFGELLASGTSIEDLRDRFLAEVGL